MNRFAELLDRLAFEPSRNNKLKLLAAYFRAAGDPDRDGFTNLTEYQNGTDPNNPNSVPGDVDGDSLFEFSCFAVKHFQLFI